MKIAHKGTVVALALAWVWSAALMWPLAVRAGTLSADLRVYDWSSLGFAALLGLLGGMLALIVALATDRRPVLQVLGESVRNALVSPIAGGAAFLGLEAITGLGWVTLPAVGRFLVIVGSGWAGIAFFLWAKVVVSKSSTVVGEWLVSKGGKS